MDNHNHGGGVDVRIRGMRTEGAGRRRGHEPVDHRIFERVHERHGKRSRGNDGRRIEEERFHDKIPI